MKKILAMILAMLLVMSMTAAFAAEDQETVNIKKTYKAVNGGVSPAETFSFSSFTQVSIAENDAATWPETLPTITDISYSEGDATSDGTGNGTKTATITLPTYTAVGVYTYSFNEVTPTTKTAGVTYNSDTLYLVVTVVQDGDNKPRVAAVHCEGEISPSYEEGSTKTDEFENTYESGTLAVSKTVTGNLGDKSKYFDVTVTFTAADGEAIKSTIKYSGGKYTTEQTVSGNTVTIQVKDSDTVTFTNVPEGVSYTVVEADYTKKADNTEDYDAAVYANSDNTTTTTGSGSIDAGDADTVGITNNKDITIDTGVILQYAPYIAILAVVLAGAILLIIRRRRNNED